MKTRISPALGIGIIVVVAALIGWFMYKSTSRQEMDTSASLSPELRAKIMGQYGGAQQSSAAPRGSSVPAQGTR